MSTSWLCLHIRISCIPRPPRTIISSCFLSPFSSRAEIQGNAGGNRCKNGGFGGKMLLVASGCNHNHEMRQCRKASTEERDPVVPSTALLCVRRLSLTPSYSSCGDARCCHTQIASGSALRAVCSSLLPGSAALVLDFLQATPPTGLVLFSVVLLSC